MQAWRLTVACRSIKCGMVPSYTCAAQPRLAHMWKWLKCFGVPLSDITVHIPMPGGWAPNIGNAGHRGVNLTTWADQNNSKVRQRDKDASADTQPQCLSRYIIYAHLTLEMQSV
jgi:hypothetical protein